MYTRKDYEKSEDKELPDFKNYKSDVLVTDKLDLKQHFTEPPARYTEAKLIKALEELGVGCQWPIGSIAQMKDKKFNIYSILLTRDGEILKEQTETGSIRNAVELGRKIGRVFEDYV